MKKDISCREDIHFLITEFYHKLLNDNSISHFFDHIIKDNSLEHHLNTITDFWNGILFNATDYQRNAMQPHLDLNKTIPFKKEHFTIWLNHFNKSVDDNFTGEKALMAKTRALSIATIMEIKTIHS